MDGIITAQEAMANSEKRIQAYRLGDACERAFDKYQADMIRKAPDKYHAFSGDKSLLRTVSALFFSAASQAELDSYMDKTPAELAEIAAQKRG